MEDMKHGTFSFEGGVTNVVEELTGSPEETFDMTARRYAAWPYAHQTLGNRLKAFINFNLTPFYADTHFDKWDRKMRFPLPAMPTLHRGRAVAQRPRGPDAPIAQETLLEAGSLLDKSGALVLQNLLRLA